MITKSSLKSIANGVLSSLDAQIVKKSKMPFFIDPKYNEEINFWKECYKRFNLWYDGKLEPLFGEPTPSDAQKIKGYLKGNNALLTWMKVHQSPKYLEDLELSPDSFAGGKLLDIGSGPFPSAQAYKDCDIYCLDPLIPIYLESGYPIHIYEPRIKFVFGFSEKIPFKDNFFDAIISVNAIDHVDDFEITVKEIRRVAKPNAKLRFHIHYHKKTKTEPIELNDERVAKAFSWNPDFKKISESNFKRGDKVGTDDQKYTLWSNF